MKKLFNILAAISISFLGNACALYDKSNYEVPYTYDEKAPDIWKLGWQHGCKSGFSAYGNDFYKSLYNFEQDVEKMKDATYFKAWMDSLNYCRSIANRDLGGETLISSPKRPGILAASSGFNITSGNRRNTQDIFKTGFFEGSSTEGFFEGLFSFNLPGWTPDKEAGCGFLFPCPDDESGGVGWTMGY